MMMPDEDEIRTAIANRDRNYDGAFFYGVVTTGIFCKPSCSSRQARPENQRYFEKAELALTAGYRSCKRCKPLEISPELKPFVDIARYIESHADERLTLADLSERAGLSVSRFQRVFKLVFSVSPKVFQDGLRMNRFRSALKAGDEVTDAIYAAGYGSISRVYGEEARNIGMTPKAYRAGGEGETITFACRKTSLGPMLMAATQKGVCFAQFADSFESLVSKLALEFPNAKIISSKAEDSPELDVWIAELEKHISEGAPRPELPLDLRGTAFQMKVWQFLLSIREGDVISYGELAAGIDKPKAFRAVASACGANRVGVLVPCHRVLRGDGNLGGYRWGEERKRALLDAERSRKSGSG